MCGKLRVMRRRHALVFLLSYVWVFLSFNIYAEFAIRSRKIADTNYLHLEDIVKYFGFKLQSNKEKIYLSNEDNNIILPIGRRTAFLNSVVSQLSFAPRLNRQSYFISEQDFLLVIDPIVRKGALPKHQVNRIVLDPGHGGKDSGAVGSKLVEKNVNLTLAKNLKSFLESRGYSVLLTRNNDEFVSLRQRGRIAHSWKADLFISIHCNAAPNKQVTGIETFIVTPRGSPSTSKNFIQKKTVPGNSFDTLNARLAHDIQRDLISTTGASDRGVKYYRWQVLREATCPAVLVETGFLSNVEEEKRLASPEYRRQLISALARGINTFHAMLANIDE